MSQQDPPGGQVGRTRLAWERSAVGLFATSAVLLLRHTSSIPVGEALVAGLAIALGLASLLLARRRVRAIWDLRTSERDPDLHWVPDARWEVRILGWGLAVIAAASVVALVLG